MSGNVTVADLAARVGELEIAVSCAIVAIAVLAMLMCISRKA